MKHLKMYVSKSFFVSSMHSNADDSDVLKIVDGR